PSHQRERVGDMGLRELFNLLSALAVPPALALAVILSQWSPLIPVRRWASVAPLFAIGASFVAGGLAYLVPRRSGRWTGNNVQSGIFATSFVLMVVCATWYLLAAPVPPVVGWFTFHYYVLTPALFMGTYFAGAYCIARVLLVVSSRIRKTTGSTNQPKAKG